MRHSAGPNSKYWAFLSPWTGASIRNLGIPREKTDTSPFLTQNFDCFISPDFNFFFSPKRWGFSVAVWAFWNTPERICKGSAYCMENNPGNRMLRSAHDCSLFPTLSTGDIPQEKPAWDQLWNSLNKIHGCRSTGWAKIIYVNLVSRVPHVLVSSYRFNACHIPWKDMMLRSISTDLRQIVCTWVRFHKIWSICLVIFLNWLNWMLSDSSLHSRHLIPAIHSIPVGFLIKYRCYFFFTWNWLSLRSRNHPPHACSFLSLKEEDEPETLDTGKINIPN